MGAAHAIEALGWMRLALAQQAPAAAPASGSDFRPVLFMFLALGLLFYFIIIRPQRREQRQRQSMLDAVTKGDHVVTAGGIHGTVEAIDLTKGIVSLQVAPRTTIRVNKSALASVTPRAKAREEAQDEAAEAAKAAKE